MDIIKNVSKSINDPLQTFKFFERTIAAICIAIPAILRLTDKGMDNFRTSISDYVYMEHSYVFGLLLCMAGMLFIFNGAVYFKSERNFRLNKHGKWYNIVLGVSLIMVIIFPHDQYPIPHYTFAVIFFVGNALVIGIFHRKKYRAISIVLSVLTLISFVFSLLHMISLFWAEWISLTVIGIHLILEARDKMTFRQNDIKP